MNFEQSIETYAARLDLWRRQIGRAAPPSGETLGVVVTAWMQTAVPLLSIEIALFYRSLGRSAVIFFDDAGLNFNEYDERPWEMDLIRNLVSKCSDLVPVVHVSGLEPMDHTELEAAELDTLIFEAGVHRFYGEDPSEAHLLRNPGISALYQFHLARVSRAAEQVDRFFLPGGFYGVSCLYTIAAKRKGKKLTTYDCTMRGLWYCTHGVAAWSDTLPSAYHAMRRTVSEDDYAVMRAHCDELLDKRRTGKDYYELQVKVAGEDNPDVDVLVCLNWRPDTAAILRQKLFADVRTWLRKVGRWAVLNQKQLVIRRHPAERLEGYFVSDDIDRQVRDLDPKGKFIKVIGPSDPVNTYDLLQNAKVVLPYTSQVGIESIMLGKPTILCTECFYGDCDFAWEADSQDEYFRLIASGCRGELVVTEDQNKLATLCYFIFQHGLEIVTDFRPLMDCFEMWSKLTPEDLWNDKCTEIVRRIVCSPEKLLAVELTEAALQDLRATAVAGAGNFLS